MTTTKISRPKRIAAIGGQYGDEGKAAVLDYIIKKAIDSIAWTNGGEDRRVVVQRWQGGANAGHTITRGKEVYKVHQVPSGIVSPGTFSLIGRGMYVNPRKLKKEIEALKSQGIEITPENLGIASNAQVTLDHHVQGDQSSFQRENHSSTGNGIKQTAADKYGRTGLRFQTFLDPNQMFNAFFRSTTKINGDLGDWIDSYTEERNFLREFAVVESNVVSDPRNAFWVGEGAQGTMLDPDIGHYPGTSSSHPSIAPYRPTLLSIFKAYQSSVGNGERKLIGQLEESLESQLVDEWDEKGTTTGRKRSLTYFDAVLGRYSINSTDPDYLAITCMDRMEAFYKLGEPVKIVTGYKIGSETYDTWQPRFNTPDGLNRVEPVYEEFEPWEKFAEDGTITKNATNYLHRIYKILGREIALVKTGPDTKDMIELKDILKLVS